MFEDQGTATPFAKEQAEKNINKSEYRVYIKASSQFNFGEISREIRRKEEKKKNRKRAYARNHVNPKVGPEKPSRTMDQGHRPSHRPPSPQTAHTVIYLAP